MGNQILSQSQLKKSANGNSRINILHIIDGFRMGGAENKLCELIEKTDQKKFQIALVNVGPMGPLENKFKNLNVKIFDLQRKYRFDLLPFIKLYHIIKTLKIDIIQTTLFWADFIGAFVGKIARVKTVISWETVTHSGKYYHNNLQRKYGYRFAMNFCDNIIAVSAQVKQSLKQYPGLNSQKVKIIHYGVDLEKFKPLPEKNRIQKRKEINLPENAFVILVVGRLEPQKGHKNLIKAVDPLIKENKNLFVLLVGEGSQQSDLEKQIRESGLNENIRLLGRRDDICNILNSVDLFCLPSIAGEGLPNAILEAMACGVPTVATDVGGSSEIVTNGFNGFIVSPNSSNQLHSAILKLVNDASLLKNQSKIARERVVRDFSLRKQIEDFQNLYLELSKS